MPPSRPPVAPARLRWALEVLDPRPDEQLLEVGAGPGVLAALICSRLTTGRLLALDRSPVAVRRTRERNPEHLAARRLVVQQADLVDADLPADGFDQALAVDVNLFWARDPGPELDLLIRALRPGGRLHLLYGRGPTPAHRITATVADRLAGLGLEVETRDAPDGCGVSAGTQPAPR
ncbi:hypothetical protein GCM10009616_07540 [Microlunatus lacustris]